MSLVDDVGSVTKAGMPSGPVETSKLSLASLALGIASWCVLPIVGALGAIITGHMALGRIKRSGGRLEGRGLAWVGLGLGYAQFAIVTLALIIAAAFLAFGVGYVQTRTTPGPSVTFTTVENRPAPVALTQGVKMANEIGRREADVLEKLNLTTKEEPILCAYIAGGTAEEPELAALTSKRVTYTKEGRPTQFDLKDVTAVMDDRMYAEKYLQGQTVYNQFNIEIKGKDNQRMRIVIKPREDGPSFFEALNDAWKAAGGTGAEAKKAP